MLGKSGEVVVKRIGMGLMGLRGVGSIGSEKFIGEEVLRVDRETLSEEAVHLVDAVAGSKKTILFAMEEELREELKEEQGQQESILKSTEWVAYFILASSVIMMLKALAPLQSTSQKKPFNPYQPKK